MHQIKIKKKKSGGGDAPSKIIIICIGLRVFKKNVYCKKKSGWEWDVALWPPPSILPSILRS